MPVPKTKMGFVCGSTAGHRAGAGRAAPSKPHVTFTAPPMARRSPLQPQPP